MLAVCFFGVHESGKFIFERGGDGFFIFQFQREPFASRFFHSSGRREIISSLRVEIPSASRTATFLRPNPKTP